VVATKGFGKAGLEFIFPRAFFLAVLRVLVLVVGQFGFLHQVIFRKATVELAIILSFFRWLAPANARDDGRFMYRNQVRIIGGEWKRRLLTFPDHQGLRPTADRVRETLFNWLGQDLTGLSCLDLFAGSGALGFEAASRHARQVVMVDLARPVIAALRKNADSLGAGSRVEVVAASALAYLQSTSRRFDVIFVDPPFASDLLAQVLPILERCLHDGCLVYIESVSMPVLPPGWLVMRQGKAGKVFYMLCQQRGAGLEAARQAL
jgi:16S rRNA (guanine966-N2)-methyltransferase